MDLVREDEDVELRGEVGESEQLLAGPHPADRVVGVAQDHRPRVRSDERGLEDGEIANVSPLPIAHERRVDRGAAVVFDDRPEGVIDGLLDDDAVAGLRESPDGVSQSRDHASGGDDRHRVDLPAETARLPGGDGLEIGCVRTRVPEDSVGDAFVKRPDDGGGRPMVHVRNPHGQDRLGVPAALTGVPFQRLRVLAVNERIEIELFGHLHAFLPVVEASVRFQAPAANAMRGPERRSGRLRQPPIDRESRLPRTQIAKNLSC